MDINTMFLLVSFCGGAFGAALGALPAFILCGFVGLVGVAAGMAGSTFNWHQLVTFGPFFGPHISFASGCAAAAYARKMGYIKSGKEITNALVGLKRPDILAVGGVFGLLAYIVQTGAASIASLGQMDTVAFTVLVIQLIAKVIFGDGFFGRLSPEASSRGRFVLGGDNRWLPWQETMGEKVMIGLAAGGLSAFITSLMLANPLTAGNAPFVGFLISAVILVFLQYGTTVPVSHHITLCAAYGTLFSGGNILWGVVMAIIASMLSDIGARIFFIHGDTHVDPPAFAIFTGSILAYYLGAVGVYKLSANTLPLIIIAIFVLWGVYDWNKTRTKIAIVNSPSEPAA